MLKTFRGAGSRWFVIGLLGLVLIALVVTGFGSGGSGIGDLAGGSPRLATVGNQVVDEQEFQRRLNHELKIAQQERADLDMPTFIRLGGFDSVLERVIAEKAQLAFAGEHNIAVSKRMIDGEIASQTAFQNAAGKFDDGVFRQTLGRLELTEADLRERIRVDLLRQQIVDPAAHGALAPTAVLHRYTSLLLETRTGLVGAVSNQAVGSGAPPTEQEIAAFFKAHPAKYTIPERRVIRYALFGWNDVVGSVTPTDAEIEAAYRQAAAQYAPKEIRTVAQLTLADQAAANRFVANVRGGKSFEAAAAEAGFAPGDIVRAEGARDQVAGKLAPPVASAAFSGAQGSLVGPVRSPLGWHVARVERVSTTPGKSLADARGELAAAIQQRKAAEKLEALVAKLDDDIANGATFDEVAQANGLKTVDTPPITKAGTVPGTDFQLPAEIKPLLTSSFDLDPDDDPMVETLAPGQRYALVKIRQVVEPTLPPLAAVQEQVKADMLAERSAKRAKELADRLVAKVNAGTPLREALSSAGVALPAAQPIKLRRIEATRAGDRLPPAVQQLFQLQQGKARAVAMPDGQGWFIVQAETITPGDPNEVPRQAEQLRPGFNQDLRGEYSEQIIRAIMRDVGVKRNDANINRLKQKLQSGGAQ